MLRKTKPDMIGIAGSSCAGKTVLANQLVKKLGEDNSSLIQLDSYYHDLSHLSHEQIEAYNYDLPDALEKDLLIKDIKTISEGGEIHIPVYDYVTHTRTGEEKLVKPAKFVLVEGLFTLYWEALRKIFDKKIFINAKDSVCFHRRVERDIKERGVRKKYVLRQYETAVRPMFDQFIKPTMEYADVIVNGEEPTEKTTLNIINNLEL